MEPLRPEIRELIRASEAVLSLESFGAHLSADERGIILLCAGDLTKKFTQPGTVKADEHTNGQGRNSEHMAELL